MELYSTDLEGCRWSLDTYKGFHFTFSYRSTVVKDILKKYKSKCRLSQSQNRKKSAWILDFFLIFIHSKLVLNVWCKVHVLCEMIKNYRRVCGLKDVSFPISPSSQASHLKFSLSFSLFSDFVIVDILVFGLVLCFSAEIAFWCYLKQIVK